MKATTPPLLLTSVCLGLLAPLAMADPLPSWNQGDNKSTIIDFVESTTTPGHDDFVPREARIAVFDNDGTLWSEQPIYFQLQYTLDRTAEAPDEALDTPLKRAAAEGDIETVLAGGSQGLDELLSVTHSDISIVDYQADVRDWLENARHPATGRAYTNMVYQPMLELLSYLRDEGYQTYIVSGGGLHFMRTFASDSYGIAPQNIIGSTAEVEWTDDGDTPVMMKRSGTLWYDDGPAKPIAIERHIGVRPVIAVGNSDGDVPMLTWTTAGDGPHLGLLVHHTDGEREVAYDRDSAIGGLDQGLDLADAKGWQLIDMANDWLTLYPEAP
ncbi:HAD family hydrolase [Halomonas sp. V046]|uniref:HAD family hydrolase n=1 Tax=Halomonas sp. V046 TaxID=3459611 RepID=UPI00404476CC